MIEFGLVVLLVVGTCTADLSAWDQDAGLNMNRKHFSQHEASVNAARKGAAERLTRIGAGAGTNACGTSICYSSSGFSDNSDAETLGHGIVGFNAGSAGSTSSSSKYQASSHHESAAAGVVPVYPAIGSTKSSYVSSAQRHSASSVNAAQPVNYISSAEGVKTRSNFGASSGTTVVQPIVASAYPIGQESAQSSQYASASRNTNAGVYTVPVDASNAYRTRSSYVASSERQAAGVAQPVYTASGDQASKYVAASAIRQENQQRYVPSNTYVVYGKPVPVYGPVSSSGIDSSARYSNSEGSIYRVPVPVVYPVRSSSNQYSAADNQQTYIAHAGQPVYGVSSDHSSLSNQQRYNSQYVRPTYQPVYSNHLAASQQSQESHSHASDRGSTVGVVVAPVVTSSANRVEKEERHEEYSRKGSSYVPLAGSSGHPQYVRPVYQPVYSNHVAAASQQSQESQSRALDSGSTVGVVVAPVVTSSANRVEKEERHEEYSRKGSTYVPLAVNTGATASKYSAHNEHRSQSGASYAPLAAASSSESHSQRHNSASQYSAAQQHASNAGSYYPAGAAASHGSRYSASESQNAYNQQQRVAGGYSPYPITNDALGQRFGAVGLELDRNDDLGGLMSESERLARLQAKNAYNGAVTGSAAVDMENRFSGANDDATGDVGGGMGTGFKRTKSWSSSSKWASGQKFGDDGKIKSYSSLSTAESEQHNINGKKTGYKAATTTLEDDGKVSTYSLHTP